MKNTKTNGAIRHIRVGGVECTIWKNVVGDRESLSVTLKRNYKSRDGQWKSTYSLRQNELPKALLALQKAFEHIALSRA